MAHDVHVRAVNNNASCQPSTCFWPASSSMARTCQNFSFRAIRQHPTSAVDVVDVKGAALEGLSRAEMMLHQRTACKRSTKATWANGCAQRSIRSCTLLRRLT